MAQEINKIKESEMLVVGGAIFAIDGLCVLIDLIPGVGLAISMVVQGFTNFLMMQWFKNKGSNPGKLGKQILKYVLGELPSGNFWVFVVSAVIHNNQNKLGALRKIEGGRAAIGAAKGATGVVGKIKAAGTAYQEKAYPEEEKLAA